jgi:ribonuclease HI
VACSNRRQEKTKYLDIPIEVEQTSYSYRHELIGIYEGLSEILENRKHIRGITCHCDNEAGIVRIEQPIYAPAETTAPDMDVVIAIKQLLENHPEVHVTFKHVKGHANDKKPKHKCSWIEQLNIDCDEEAEECVGRNHTPTPFQPLPGSKCMVRISGKWITSRVDIAMQLIPSALAQEEYLLKRLQTTTTAIADIDRETIAAARSNRSWPRLVKVFLKTVQGSILLMPIYGFNFAQWSHVLCE